MRKGVRRIRTVPSWIGPDDFVKIERPIKPGCGLAYFEDGRPVKRFTAPRNAVDLCRDEEGWYWLIERRPGGGL